MQFVQLLVQPSRVAPLDGVAGAPAASDLLDTRIVTLRRKTPDALMSASTL
jgi:hypothetical protein